MSSAAVGRDGISNAAEITGGIGAAKRSARLGLFDVEILLLEVINLPEVIVLILDGAAAAAAAEDGPAFPGPDISS